MKLKNKFTTDGLKICNVCGSVEDRNDLFKKGKHKCRNCINSVRRSGHEKKMATEKSLIEKEYKQQWYQENKERLSAESKINYLNNREKRLEGDKARYYNSDNIISNLLRGSRQRAKCSSIDFNLNKEIINAIFEQQDRKCAVTGIPFVFERQVTSRRPFAPSIDRINSKLGYTEDNIRLVCVIVNYALNEFGDDNFDFMCKEYIKNIRNKE